MALILLHHYHPHWTICKDVGTPNKNCEHYLLLKQDKHPVGIKKWCRNRTCITWPRFSLPKVATTWKYVTGYSYQCGDVNGTTSDGTIPVPWHTVSSDDGSLWHKHIAIPSLGLWNLYVDDHGAPLDVFTPNCSIALQVTGSREIFVYG